MRKRWWLLAGPLVAAYCATAVLAQGGQGDAGQADSTEQHAAGDAHGETAPLLSFDPGSAIWTIVVFGLLLVILRAAAWKPILNALQQREKFIHDSITDAKHEREAADKLLVKYREQIDHAREEATAIIEKGKRDVEDVRRRIHEDARKESDEMIVRARREIELASQNAIKELYDHTAELAVLAAGRVVSKTLSVEDHRELVQESLDRMKSEGPSLN